MNAQQLKNSILQEAIMGKLVPQDPNDEPASVLLDKIRKEKARLVKEGKLKKKDLEETPISEDEIPFEIPESWKWCNLGTIASVLGGKRIPAGRKLSIENTGHIYIRVSDMKDNTVSTDNLQYVPEDIYPLISRYIINKEDVYVTVAGTIGKVGKIPSELDGANLTENADRLVFSHINQDWLIKCLESNVVQSQITDITTKVGQPKLAILRIQTLLIPLPPLAEQHRIVAKIEELLPKVEEYGKAQEALDKLNEELPEKLKKSILQEAISGKLVPQDPNDEPASVLLDKIRKEKARLVKEGKLKKKDLEETPISDDEIPFELPKGWEWCHLGDVGVFERGNGIKRDETSDFGYPCVRYGEMYTRYKYAPTFQKTVSFTNKSVFEKCRKAHKGDLFMALTGENKQDISLAAMYVGDEEIAVGGDLCHFTILEAYALYFVYLINSKYFSSKKEVLATGDIIVHISTDKLASITIPLPPLAEQHRIVAKIEQLMKEIDKLNNKS